MADGAREDGSRDVSVLVVYVNFAVATAVSQRLLDLASIELARPRSAVLHLSGRRHYDAVVLCPYLSPTDRQRVLSRCHADAAPTTSIDLLDTEEGMRVEVSDCPRARASETVSVLPRPLSAALEAVVAALSAPGQPAAGQPEVAS